MKCEIRVNGKICGKIAMTKYAPTHYNPKIDLFIKNPNETKWYCLEHYIIQSKKDVEYTNKIIKNTKTSKERVLNFKKGD